VCVVNGGGIFFPRVPFTYVRGSVVLFVAVAVLRVAFMYCLTTELVIYKAGSKTFLGSE